MPLPGLFAGRPISRRELLKSCAAAASSFLAFESLARPRPLQTIKLKRAIAELPFGEGVLERFILDGHLVVSDSGLGGEVTVAFANGSAARIRGANAGFDSSYRGVSVHLPIDGDNILVNGMPVKVRSVVEQLIAENDFAGIGSLSDQSRAVVALNALANADAFFAGIRIAKSLGGNRVIDKLCRLSPAPSAAARWWTGQLGWERATA